METLVQELKGLLQYLFPLALLLAVVLLRGYLRRAGRGRDGEGIGVPPEESTPARLHSVPRSEVTPAEGRPEIPREPEASRESRRSDRPFDRPPARSEPVVSGTGRRLRRLLAHREGRRLALLVHEVFRPPEGWGPDETRR